MSSHKLFQSLYQIDHMFESFGATVNEIKKFNELLDELKKEQYVYKKEYKGPGLIMDFINSLDAENEYLFLMEFPEESSEDAEDQLFEISTFQRLQILAMVNFSAVLWMRTFNVNITDPEDFGAVSFSRVMSVDNFDTNIKSLVYLGEIGLIPMFLKTIEILLSKSIYRNKPMQLHESAQSSLYALLHVLQQERNSSDILGMIREFSNYCMAISRKNNEDDTVQYHSGEAIYHFDIKLAKLLVKHHIAVNVEYDMEKGLYDVFSDSVEKYISAGNVAGDFRDIGLMILHKCKVEFTDDGLIILNRKGAK